MLVTDRDGHPVTAVEVQEIGYNLSKDPGLRDGIKRTAWEKAGIHYIEVHSPLDRQALSTHLLNRRQSRVSTSKDSVSNNANSFEASNAPVKFTYP